MIDLQAKAAKLRFSIATAAALGGDGSAWRRAEIHAREVRRLQAEIRKQPPKPEGPWAEMQRIRGEG